MRERAKQIFEGTIIEILSNGKIRGRIDFAGYPNCESCILSGNCPKLNNLDKHSQFVDVKVEKWTDNLKTGEKIYIKKKFLFVFPTLFFYLLPLVGLIGGAIIATFSEINSTLVNFIASICGALTGGAIAYGGYILFKSIPWVIVKTINKKSFLEVCNKNN